MSFCLSLNTSDFIIFFLDELISIIYLFLQWFSINLEIIYGLLGFWKLRFYCFQLFLSFIQFDDFWLKLWWKLVSRILQLNTFNIFDFVAWFYLLSFLWKLSFCFVEFLIRFCQLILILFALFHCKISRFSNFISLSVLRFKLSLCCFKSLICFNQLVFDFLKLFQSLISCYLYFSYLSVFEF